MNKLLKLSLYFLLIFQIAPVWSQDNRVASSKEVSGQANAIIMPEENQVKVELLVTEILGQYHYRKMDLNDSLSSVILDNYLTALDNNKVYFLASDIQNFEQYRNTLDDDLKRGNL